MRFLKIMLYFLCIMLAMALLASMLTTISNSIFGRVELSNHETIFERLGIDALAYWLALPYTSFFFVIIISLMLLQLKSRIKLLHMMLLSVAAGLVFSYLTKHLILSFIVRHANELSYIVVVSTCMLLFPIINKKFWELFKKKVPFFQNILYFLLLLLAMVSVVSILLTFSDYILHGIYGGGYGDENVFQRLGTYLFLYFLSSFSSFFFLILIFLCVLQIKFRFKVLYILAIGVPLGFYFSYLTKGLIWSLYIEDEKKPRYILVVTICMVLFPFINKKLWELFNKKKEKRDFLVEEKNSSNSL